MSRLTYWTAECADIRPSARAADCGQSAPGNRPASELARNRRGAVGGGPSRSAVGEGAQLALRRIGDFGIPGGISSDSSLRASEPPGDSVSHPKGLLFV